MMTGNKDFIAFKEIDKVADNGETRFVKPRENIKLAIKEAIKTRTRKDNGSIYTYTPTREIRKWFETRRF